MFLRLACLLVALSTLAGPATADERVNAAQVYACLTRTDDPAACAGTLAAPCAHMVQAGLMRACLYRLRLRWEDLLRREADTLIAALPRDRAEALGAARAAWRAQTDRACGRIGRNEGLKSPETASAERNRCRIGLMARRWVWVADGARGPVP